MPPSELDRPFPLSSDQIAAFARDGFIRLKKVFSPETLASYGARITERTIALSTETRPLEERSTYDRAFLQVMNLWEDDSLVREFVMGRRLARIAAELLGVTGVRLYHDQSLYKEPGGGITPAHADQYYWPLETDRTVTAWIPLQAVASEMGPLAFFAGSQHMKVGREMEISDESERAINEMMQAHRFPIVDAPFELGEVSFHQGWTFHRAGENRSGAARSVMTIIYMDEGMRLKAPSNANQAADWERWCPGAQPGEVIATPMNPVIFSRGRNQE